MEVYSAALETKTEPGLVKAQSTKINSLYAPLC